MFYCKIWILLNIISISIGGFLYVMLRKKRDRHYCEKILDEASKNRCLYRCVLKEGESREDIIKDIQKIIESK